MKIPCKWRFKHVRTNVPGVEGVESFTENNEETRDLCPMVQKCIMSSKRENVFKKYSLENQLC
jgi:hypothetical protein